MRLDSGEIADPPSAVHLLHETIADPRHQLRAPFVLPLLELHGSRDLEAVEELASDRGLGGVKPTYVRLNRAGDERNRGSLYQDVLAPDLFLQYRQRLGERVAGPRGSHIGP